MKKMKLGALAMIVVLGLSGCGGSTESTENVNSADTGTENAQASSDAHKVSMIYQDLSGQFNIYFQGELQKKAAEMGIDLVEFDGQGAVDKQLDQCENAIQKGVDALMFIPVDKSGCVPIIEKCNEAGVTVICCNNPTDNSEDATAYVGANDIDAGIMEMEYMAELLDGKGTICVIEGPYGHYAQIARMEGIEETLAKYPDIKMLYHDTANWDRTEAMELTENWLEKSGNQIDAIVCHSDDMGMGALQAIQGAGLQDKIKVIGIDAIYDALQAVKKQEMAATVFQDVYGQADEAIETAEKALNGETFEKTVYVPFQLVTVDNVDDYLAMFD